MSRNVVDAANTIGFHLDELLDEAEATVIKEELDAAAQLVSGYIQAQH